MQRARARAFAVRLRTSCRTSRSENVGPSSTLAPLAVHQQQQRSAASSRALLRSLAGGIAFLSLGDQPPSSSSSSSAAAAGTRATITRLPPSSRLDEVEEKEESYPVGERDV